MHWDVSKVDMLSREPYIKDDVLEGLLLLLLTTLASADFFFLHNLL